jgi:DNA-binding CsgD family transcriptional regulator
LLQKYYGLTRHPARLPSALREWARHWLATLGRTGSDRLAGQALVVERGEDRLVVRLLPEWTDREYLLLLDETTASPPALDGLGLSERESEVLWWVARGKTNADIGAILAISPRTVQKHLEHMFAKLGVETRTAAAAYARDWLNRSADAAPVASETQRGAAKPAR